MVLINDKKYACATCIKGHRVSGCTHTDRPLFEVKKKGRPATQCACCRERRKGGNGSGSVHTKCTCGDLKNQQLSSIIIGPDGAVRPNPDASADAGAAPVETKKGQPGSTPTFPNGLRDVHEMAAAAQALSGMGDTGNQAAERKLQNLLNPCNCATTGKCKCCGTKPSRQYPPARGSSPPRDTTHAVVTDSLIEMFKSKATTSSTPSDRPNSGSSTPQQPPSYASMRGVNLSMTSANTLASPDNRHHPTHTSPYVHKTRLYSPYSTNGSSTPRRGSKPRSESVSSTGSLSGGTWMGSSATSPRPPPSRIRPLTDMNRFLGAAFKEDGTMATEISRSALGLPGIDTFDAAASNGGVKIEPMAMDVDAPVSFPTAEDVVIGACTCGEGCECPGCATHGNQRRPSTSSNHEHAHESCGDACKSCFDCSENVSIPSGVTSIEHLIQVAASSVPPNPPRRHATHELNPLDTSVLPPAAGMSEDAARAFGLVQLLPLKCCNGRCQCPPGQCSCQAECCGCCVRCLCDHDGDAVMSDNNEPERPQKAGCCSTSSPTNPAPPVIQNQPEVPTPAGRKSVSPGPSPIRPTPAIETQHLSVAGVTTPSTLSPTSPTSGPRPLSPGSSPRSCCQTTTPPNGATGGPGVRRTPSVSRAKEASNAGPTTGRRVSVSNGSGAPRSASSTKAASKALALHPNQPRPILPKPSSNSRLTIPRSNSNSTRQASPVHRGSISGSSQQSQNCSPVNPPLNLAAPGDTVTLPDAASDSASNAGDIPARSNTLQVPGALPDADQSGMAVGVDDIANALAASDVDFMAYLNSVLTTGNEGTEPTADPSAANSSTSADHLAGSGYSFATSLAVSSATSDLSLLDLAPQPTGQATRTTDFESSMGDIHQLIANTLEQQGIVPRAEVPTGDYTGFLLGMPSGGQEPVYGLQNNPMAVPSTLIRPQAHPPSQPASQPQAIPSLFFNNFPPGYAPIAQPHVPHNVVSSDSSTGEQLRPHIPPPSVRTPQPHSQAQGFNPDIIDLSKPLNPSDVDRILQALLTQQARAATGTTQDVSLAQPPPPPLPQAGASRPSTASTAERGDVFEDYLFDPALVDIHGQHPQGQLPHMSTQQQQQQQQQQREWLLKNGWTPELLNQTPT